MEPELTVTPTHYRDFVAMNFYEVVYYPTPEDVERILLEGVYAVRK